MWTLTCEPLERGGATVGRGRSPVSNIVCSNNCFCPKVRWNYACKRHAASFVKKCPVLSLYYTVLVWSVSLCQLTSDSRVIAESYKIISDILTAIVKANGLNAVRALELYHGFEVSDLSQGFRFSFKEENSCKFAKIVYDGKDIP